MKAVLKLYSGLGRYLDEYNRDTGLQIDFTDRMTVKEVLIDRGIPLKIINMVLVGDDVVNLDYQIKDGDVVKVVPPIGGG